MTIFAVVMYTIIGVAGWLLIGFLITLWSIKQLGQDSGGTYVLSVIFWPLAFVLIVSEGMKGDWFDWFKEFMEKQAGE